VRASCHWRRQFASFYSPIKCSASRRQCGRPVRLLLE
jgi:hypothetical protein